MAGTPTHGATGTNALGWPTMGYTNFLAGHPDEAKRAQMWKFFLAAEHEAKLFAETPERWRYLKAATLGTTGPKWISTGRIQLSAASDSGAMFHEIFHNAFDKSRFRQAEDNAWSEAFCDAFRYMMEKKLLSEPHSKWFLKIDRFSRWSYAQVMAKSGDKHFDRKYLYPASLIVQRADKDPEKFRTLWFELLKLRQAKGASILDNYFAYDMRKGQPL